MSVLEQTRTGTSPKDVAWKKRRSGLGLSEAFRVSLEGLVANKMRSFLTMLGIIIGVSAVIIMIALGQGVAKATQEAIEKLGTNVLTIIPNQQRTGGVAQGMGTQQTLKLPMVDVVRKCFSVKLVSPEVRSGNITVKYMQENTRTNVFGVSPEYFEIRNLPLADGRLFTEEEVKRRSRVAVIGHDVRDVLFGGIPPVGKEIKINGQNFEVIGVTQKRGGMAWRNPDDQVTVPVTTAMRRVFGQEHLNSLSVQAVDKNRMLEAEEEVKEALMRALRARPGEEPVRVFNQADLTESAEEQSTFLTMLLAGIALVSLIVGGIGIMNIMLVSVTERTREIGIRKAIGAKRRDILYQFLIESVTLSLVGGLIGIALGLGASMWMMRPADEGGLGYPMLLSMPPVVLAFSFSALVGIFFGIYPAMKASRLDPIQALRYE
jgi:putative ABC transport system permease protein